MKKFLDLLINSLNDWAASTDDASKDASLTGIVLAVKAVLGNPVVCAVSVTMAAIAVTHYGWRMWNRPKTENRSLEPSSTPQSPDGDSSLPSPTEQYDIAQLAESADLSLCTGMSNISIMNIFLLLGLVSVFLFKINEANNSTSFSLRGSEHPLPMFLIKILLRLKIFLLKAKSFLKLGKRNSH